ncbi:MAG TPA: hypothetical protein VN493_30770 [Thermoanaerobaculia bacterium]|nr:hypothetical protein [Thermoanaerobaculia bacterium]
MQLGKRWLRGVFILVIAAGAMAPSSATTLVRAGLESLVAGNEKVVVAEVREAHSYWNEEQTSILTDVRLEATEVLKGDPRDTEITVTILGGSVGDLTELIVGGAELIPGKSYVLFLNEDGLPGVQRVLTVREHSQGVFEVVRARDGYRAISQANRHPLVPDALGFVDPPGGAKGLLLNDMIGSIREFAGRQGTRREVK